MPQRLASVLLRLAPEPGNVLEGISHQELGDMVGANHETVTKLLDEWRKSHAVAAPTRPASRSSPAAGRRLPVTTALIPADANSPRSSVVFAASATGTPRPSLRKVTRFVHVILRVWAVLP